MRLSKLLEQDDLKKAHVTAVGTWKTEKHEYIVLARAGSTVFPMPKIYHLVENGPKNKDPELTPAEIDTIRRRLLKPSHHSS